MTKRDVAGVRYGRLVAIQAIPKTKNGKSVWLCHCDCGNKCEVRIDSLTTGNTSSCGCLAIESSKKSARKLGKSQRGENHPSWSRVMLFCEQCGCEFERVPNRIRSDLVFCSVKCRNSYKSGENNPNWNPDLTDKDRQELRITSGYREFINGILERDDFTCFACNDRGSIMNVHHLRSYADNPDLRMDDDNCITLCKNCHDDFHSWMGGSRYPCSPHDFDRWMKLL